MTDHINARAEFERLAAQAPTHTLRSDAGRVFDVGAAWDAYEADPDRFHRITADNPEGDPISALILSDGPWWVEEEGVE